jgi:hypothetical protein
MHEEGFEPSLDSQLLFGCSSTSNSTTPFMPSIPVSFSPPNPNLNPNPHLTNLVNMYNVKKSF